MKQFAFPLSIKYALVEERDECVKILKSIGYKLQDCINRYGIVVNNLNGDIGICSDIHISLVYEHNRHHIDHFNPDLIRDIASACTNDTWQKGELWVGASGKLSRLVGYVGFNVDPNGHRRPTLAEICEHHGYKVVGRDIVKNEPKQNDMKKYRPYKTFPNDIVGKAVMVNTGQVTLVYHLDTAKKLMQTTVKGYSCISAFEELTFTDGTPVGEEYEEAIELEHDKVYCVRMMGGYRWVARHFKCRRGNINWFHANGSSSITNENNGESLYKHIAEYDHSLINATKEPKEYLVKQD